MAQKALNLNMFFLQDAMQAFGKRNVSHLAVINFRIIFSPPSPRGESLSRLLGRMGVRLQMKNSGGFFMLRSHVLNKIYQSLIVLLRMMEKNWSHLCLLQKF